MWAPRSGVQQLDLLRHDQRAELRHEAFSEILVRDHSCPMGAPAGIVGVLPEGTSTADHLPFPMIVGGHPTPTHESERGGRAALDLAAALQPDEALVVLLSGGASALMAVPAEGLTLEDKQATTKQLLRAGADIHALNTVRKHLSAIKGGWLAARAPGRRASVAAPAAPVPGPMPPACRDPWRRP